MSDRQQQVPGVETGQYTVSGAGPIISVMGGVVDGPIPRWLYAVLEVTARTGVTASLAVKFEVGQTNDVAGPWVDLPTAVFTTLNESTTIPCVRYLIQVPMAGAKYIRTNYVIAGSVGPSWDFTVTQTFIL